MKKIAILTSGGDSPGMNMALRASAKYAFSKGFEVYGVRRGYLGMLNDEIFLMESKFVSGIVDKGGTVLLTARCPEFKEKDVRDKAVKNLIKRGIEGVVVIGGDGSFHGAYDIHNEYPIKVVGVPGTIDNDIAGTDYTIGYDTALNTVLDMVSKIRDTATSHERTYIIEVMGRDAGSVGLYSCIAGGGDGLLIPEKKFDIDDIADLINGRRKRGKLHDIIIVSEGAARATDISRELIGKVESERRVTILGHVQRGGSPSALDRIIASKMGVHAVRMLESGISGMMIGIESNKLVTYPISYAWEQKKEIDEDDYNIALILAG